MSTCTITVPEACACLAIAGYGGLGKLIAFPFSTPPEIGARGAGGFLSTSGVGSGGDLVVVVGFGFGVAPVSAAFDRGGELLDVAGPDKFDESTGLLDEDTGDGISAALGDAVGEPE